MVSLCNNCDLDRLLQALHENYLSVRTRDGNFDNVNKFKIKSQNYFKKLMI
jgi:hypothetical protein